MTQEEFNNINWHRGNTVRLKNNKEYLVKGTKSHGKFLLLFSEEYEKCFVADYKIVDCRTSDYEEPEEIYLEMKRKKQEEEEAKRQEILRAKEERKKRNLQEQERMHQEALARKAARAKNKTANDAEGTKPAAQPQPVAIEAKTANTESVTIAKTEPTPEQPKKKRKRIIISRAEKIEIK